MENETSPWVQTGEGVWSPSADLAKAYRENPEQYPNFVEDATVLTGKTREEIEAILANPLAPGGSWGSDTALGTIRRVVTMPDVRQGLAEAGGFAAKKLGFEGVGQSLQDTAASIDPQFDTEGNLGETLAEVAGQAAPAVAAGVGAGGAIAAGVAGAGVATLTFSDEDNVANMANDYADGLVPDILVINDEDDQDTRTAKHLAANLIVDLATAGLVHGIAKVYKTLKEVPSGLAELPTEASQGTPGLAEELQRIADEAGVPLRAEEGSTETAKRVVEDTARLAADDLPAASDDLVVRKGLAKDKVAEDVMARELGHTTDGKPAPAPIPQDVAAAWNKDVLGPVQRLLNRSKEVNVDRRAALKNFEEGEGYARFQELAEQGLRAAHDSNLDELVRVNKQIDGLKNVNVGIVFRNSLLKGAMEMIDDRFDEIIHLIRQDPSLKTKAAMKQVANDYHRTRVALQEMYREAGSSPAYAFLTRKGVKFDDAILKPLQEAEEQIMKEMKDNGLSIFATKAEFKAQRLLSLDEMGYDTLSVIDELDRMFEEFDAARMGTLDNFSKNAMTRMTKAQREQAQGSFLRWLNDMHSSALLGQVSTAALEGMSNALNNLALPVMQHVLGRGGGAKRAAREYAGYIAAWDRTKSIAWASLKKGRSVTDDFDILDAQHSGIKDFERLAKEGKHFQHLMYRLWDFAATLSISASEASKAMRYAGLAYADGFELALKSGMTRPNAKKAAREYVASKFGTDGSFKDAALKLDVQQTSWQSVFDTRYATGKMAQWVDNMRNTKNPLINVLARVSVPFWRTLINIGSNSAQMIQPVPAAVLKPLSRTKYGSKLVGATKFLDDFSGRNGQAALQRAKGRQRLGYLMLGGGYALMESGAIDITGPSGHGRFDAKMAEGREYPASSLIVGGKAIDLTRLLPFSAPLLLLGVMKDMNREAALQMKDGNYVSEEDSAFSMAQTYGSALLFLSYSLMSDAAALRGVGDLFDAAATAAKDGDARPVVQLAEDYAKQFMPGAPRMIGKNLGAFTGDWSQHEAEGFINEVLASSGFPVGYKRLDFLGHPVDDDWFRGVDPTNAKPVRTDDPVRAEYVLLNKTGELGLSLDKPDAVFDASHWKNLGAQPSGLDWLLKQEAPSLTSMQTTDGRNAWEVYRELVYQGVASKDIEVSTGTSGDRINIGKVTILEGENFEAAIRRTIDSPGYQDLTPDARVKVWRALFGQFKKVAKEHLKETLVVDPAVFEGSKYGKPINQPTTLQPTEAAAKERAIGVQRTRGIPLDDIFAIR